MPDSKMTHHGQTPQIRAYIFDMDGLLINTEDILTDCTNRVLQRHGRPPFTRTMRAKTMGVPGSTTDESFHEWAQLPISPEQWASELKQETRISFVDCKPLSGAEDILSKMGHARSASTGAPIELALATGTKAATFKVKSSRADTKRLLESFAAERRILGDDPRLGKGKGKPAPDIFVLALRVINETLHEGQSAIEPDQCLVFEDSPVGVEAARRAGMRVIWVPHELVAEEYAGREGEVLVGELALDSEHERGSRSEASGRAERIARLDEFNWAKYGIEVDSA